MYNLYINYKSIYVDEIYITKILLSPYSFYIIYIYCDRTKRENLLSECSWYIFFGGFLPGPNVGFFIFECIYLHIYLYIYIYTHIYIAGSFFAMIIKRTMRYADYVHE